MGAGMGAGEQWVDSIASLVRRAAQQLPDRRDQTRHFAAVEPDNESGPGWYIVAGWIKPHQLESMYDGHLSRGRDKGDEARYDVLEVVVESERIRVRASISAPEVPLELYGPADQLYRLLSGLADGLHAVRDNPLLADFADLQTPQVNLLEIPGESGLREFRKQALAAATAPGVQSIWAPPTSGRRTANAIASGIAQLAASGRRVLLVSSTDLAADSILREVARITQPHPIEVVRPGAIHLPSLRADRQEQAGITSAAQVVGTTLTQIALHPWITDGEFDHVIVDDASAAQFPHLVHAVGQARIGALLVGDRRRPGPIIDNDLPGGPQVQELFSRKWFAGPAEIVVVTVDDLPEPLRTIDYAEKRSGWWPIGALLARALAERHNDRERDGAFAVMVPFRQQRLASQGALMDADLSHVAVGTPATFPGRQFDTVLADLVDDRAADVDGRHGRLAGTRGGFDDLHLFNVAAGRAQARLYLLVARDALAAGPLAALKQLCEVRTVNIAQLLDSPEYEWPAPASPEADLLAALAPYVTIARPQNEGAVLTEVIDRIDEARSSVWCWNGWTGKDADAVARALDRARRRELEVHTIIRELKGGWFDQLAGEKRRRERLSQVVLLPELDQRLVVIDRQWSACAEPPSRPRQFMITVDGADFAARLLEQANAEELARSRTCPTCGEALSAGRQVGPNRRWAWVCSNRDRFGRPHQLFFPKRRLRGAPDLGRFPA
jgi:hypothetical protein